MSKSRIMALGGLNEDGKNMYLIEIDGDIFVVDCGLKYPNETEQLGIEYIIPDFSYILENKERVKAIFITHAHDDVMAALIHLLLEEDFPVYATALTAKVLQREFMKKKLKKNIQIIKRNADLTIAGHRIHCFPVFQSIADGIGLSFETDEGQIVYSSEYIVDFEMTNSFFSMNIQTIAQLASKPILVLMSESVGAYREGFTSPHHRITSLIEPYFERAENRILLSVYKQNLFRIIEILELAKKYKRRVYFGDEKPSHILKFVEELGYYDIPKGLLLDKKDFNNHLKDVVVVVSGSGHEVFTYMNRIALGDDREIELQNTDVVVIASPIVPGTEKEAANMEDDLYKAGVSVYKLNAKQALSMHASVEDLKMMIHLLHPRYYLPIKGEYAALMNNAQVATSMGYTPDRIVILDNGQFADFVHGKLVSTHETIALNDTFISGSDKLDIAGMVLKDRENLSTDGAIVLGIVLDFKTKKLIGGPDVQSRGVIYLKDADYILNEVGNILTQTVKDAVAENRYENMKCRQEAKEKISRYILKQTGKKPMVLPAIVEINIEAQDGE